MSNGLKVIILTHGSSCTEVYGGLGAHEGEQQQEQRRGRCHGDSDRSSDS